MNAKKIVDYVLGASLYITAFMTLDQALEIFKTKSVGSVSVLQYAGGALFNIVIIFTLFFLSGKLKDYKHLLAGNIINLIIRSVILVFYRLYS